MTLPAGAALGLLAGLTGTGGGIFLSPLIILFGWETPRHTSGVAAGFILLNSIAGLAGNLAVGARRCRPNCRSSPARSRPAPCSAPGSASSGCRASACCRRSGWC